MVWRCEIARTCSLNRIDLTSLHLRKNSAMTNTIGIIEAVINQQKPRREYRRGFWVVMIGFIHYFSDSYVRLR